MGPPTRLPPPPPPPPPMPFQHFSNGGGHHAFAWLLVLGIFLLVAAVVFFALRFATQPAVAVPGSATTPAQDLLAVVARRYANGEIPREEYLRLRADLGGSLPEAEPLPPE